MKKFYTEISDEYVNEFNKIVGKADKIIISSHISPDDDSISSVLTTYFYVTEVLKIDESKVRMIYTGEQVNTWNYFKNFDKIEFHDDLFNELSGEETIIFVDGSSWKRFSRNESIKMHQGKVICIDHHPTPEDKFEHHLVAKEYTSNAEILYRLFFEEREITPELAQTILMGIMGDTGNFKYIKPSDASLFGIAERLVKVGNVEIQTLISKYQYVEEKTYAGLVQLMSNSKVYEIEQWPKFLVSYLDKNFVEENEMSDSDVSNASGMFTQYLTKLQGVGWGFVITPRTRDGSFSISLRSLPGSVVVREVMEQMKLGGGHDRASGGKIIADSAQEAVEVIINWIKMNRPVEG